MGTVFVFFKCLPYIFASPLLSIQWTVITLQLVKTLAVHIYMIVKALAKGKGQNCMDTFNTFNFLNYNPKTEFATTVIRSFIYTFTKCLFMHNALHPQSEIYRATHCLLNSPQTPAAADLHFLWSASTVIEEMFKPFEASLSFVSNLQIKTPSHLSGKH